MPGLRIGLVYDLLGSYPRGAEDPDDVDVEYEPQETVRALEAAIRRLGHQPLRLGNPHALLDQVGKGQLPALDAALNIAEGYGGRNREAWAPVLLEMAQVPALGSDALTLSLSLDKVWAVALVAAAGVPVPAQACADSAAEAEKLTLPGEFPLFVKPRWEGTAKGIRPTSRVADRAALAREVERIARDYRQPALIEPFFAGPEYTVTVIGNDPPRALPALQRALDPDTRIGLHAVEAPATPAGVAGGAEPCLPGRLDGDLEAQLGDLAIRAYRALECRDFARADFRLDAAGVPHFLEMNPLPTFAPEGSFGILAELAGRPFDDLLAEVVRGGLERLGLA
jgi:D-alanine-D-alanine ligase